jgi:hypothetical protein
MEDKFRVTYDSTTESAFIVHTPRGPVRFTRGPKNLFYYKPEYRTMNGQFVETVIKNMKFYTPRQIEQAKQTRQWLHSIGFPTVEDLKRVIK